MVRQHQGLFDSRRHMGQILLLADHTNVGRRVLAFGTGLLVAAAGALTLATSVFSAGSSSTGTGSLASVPAGELATGGITLGPPQSTSGAIVQSQAISASQAEQAASSRFGGATVLDATYASCQAPTSPALDGNCWAVSLDPSVAGPSSAGTPTWFVVLVDPATGKPVLAQSFTPNS